MSRLRNARVTAARPPGVLDEFPDVLGKLRDDMFRIPGVRGHLVLVVQQKRRYSDEHEGQREHLHVPLPYGTHPCALAEHKVGRS